MPRSVLPFIRSLCLPASCQFRRPAQRSKNTRRIGILPHHDHPPACKPPRLQSRPTARPARPTSAHPLLPRRPGPPSGGGPHVVVNQARRPSRRWHPVDQQHPFSPSPGRALAPPPRPSAVTHALRLPALHLLQPGLLGIYINPTNNRPPSHPVPIRAPRGVGRSTSWLQQNCPQARGCTLSRPPGAASRSPGAAARTLSPGPYGHHSRSGSYAQPRPCIMASWAHTVTLKTIPESC
jgi:hypothetical protein